MTTTTDQLEIRPLTGAIGAEIFGVDLSGSLSNSLHEEIQQAFLKY